MFIKGLIPDKTTAMKICNFYFGLADRDQKRINQAMLTGILFPPATLGEAMIWVNEVVNPFEKLFEWIEEVLDVLSEDQKDNMMELVRKVADYKFLLQFHYKVRQDLGQPTPSNVAYDDLLSMDPKDYQFTAGSGGVPSVVGMQLNRLHNQWCGQLEERIEELEKKFEGATPQVTDGAALTPTGDDESKSVKSKSSDTLRFRMKIGIGLRPYDQEAPGDSVINLYKEMAGADTSELKGALIENFFKAHARAITAISRLGDDASPNEKVITALEVLHGNFPLDDAKCVAHELVNSGGPWQVEAEDFCGAVEGWLKLKELYEWAGENMTDLRCQIPDLEENWIYRDVAKILPDWLKGEVKNQLGKGTVSLLAMVRAKINEHWMTGDEGVPSPAKKGKVQRSIRVVACRHYLRGHCNRSGCAFYHGPSGNTDRSTHTRSQQQQGGGGDLRRRSTGVCWGWADQGSCRFGDECKFSHDGPQGGQVDPQPQGQGAGVGPPVQQPRSQQRQGGGQGDGFAQSQSQSQLRQVVQDGARPASGVYRDARRHVNVHPSRANQVGAAQGQAQGQRQGQGNN